MAKDANAVSRRRLPKPLNVAEGPKMAPARRFPQPWAAAEGTDVTPSRRLPQQLAVAQRVDVEHPSWPVGTTGVMRPLVRPPLAAMQLAPVASAQEVLAVWVVSGLRRPRVPVGMRLVCDAKTATWTQLAHWAAPVVAAVLWVPLPAP